MSAQTPPNPRDHALIEAGMILASELSLDAVLQRIVELAVEITDARYGALGVLTPDGRAIEEFITVGVTPEERAAIGDPPVGHGVLGLLIEEVGPLRLPDIGADPRSVGFPPNHPPMRSFLGAPVVARGRVFGNIYLTEKRDAPEFTRGGRGRAHRPRDPGRCRRRERAPVRGDAATASRAGAAVRAG